MLYAGLAYHVRCPKFILITQLHTEIRMISTLYKVGDRVPVGNKGVFTRVALSNMENVYEILLLALTLSSDTPQVETRCCQKWL